MRGMGGGMGGDGGRRSHRDLYAGGGEYDRDRPERLQRSPSGGAPPGGGGCGAVPEDAEYVAGEEESYGEPGEYWDGNKLRQARLK
eukprot:6514229-Prymnesium_polylepis.1